MKTYKIQKDKISLFIDCNGISRPLTPTKFKKGDKVAAFRFGGSMDTGIGKDKTCKKGIYLEYWCSAHTPKYNNTLKAYDNSPASKKEELKQFTYLMKNEIEHFKRINK